MTLTGRIRPKDVSLPPGWESDVSKQNGKTYFRNTMTGVTQWARPSMSIESEDNGEADDALSVRTGDMYQNSEMSSGLSYISVASGHKLDCICEICDCGKHNCKLHTTMSRYGDIQTAYQRDYPWHDPQGKYVKPRNSQLNQGTFDPNHFATTNSCAYVPHDVPARHRRPQSAPPVRSRFTAKSTYQSEHGPKELSQSTRVRQKNRLPPKIAFEHLTTSQVAYLGEEGDRRTPIKPPTRVLPATRFDSNSTYNSMFTRPSGGTPAHRVGTRQISILPEDRDFLSTKQIAFVKPEIAHCPAAKLPRKQPSKHTGHTHFHKKLRNIHGKPTYIYSP